MAPHPHYNNPAHCYLNNPGVKRAGVEQQFTEYELSEYLKCMNDPKYFAKKYIKVVSLDKGLVPFDLYQYQENMYDHFDQYRFSVVLAPRQSGKSISCCGWLLHHAIFKPDKAIAILANKGATAREMLHRIILALENLPFFLQPGCRELNKGSTAFDNNSIIFAAATSGSSIRGKSINVLYCDEFAFVEQAEEFYTSTYPVVTAGTQTKVIITSTPKGVGNMFHRIWEGAMQGTNEYKGFRVYWWDVPGRDEAWKKQTIANTSELQFAQEFLGEFLGTGSTLIDANSLLGLKSIPVIHRAGSVRIYEHPIPEHNYVMTVDVAKGRGNDYSTFTIIDVSTQPFRAVACYRDNLISPLLFPDIIYKWGKVYSYAHVVVESNDQGTVVCNALHYDLEYENLFLESLSRSDGVGVTMTKKTKRIGCSNLKDLIEQGKLSICDAETIQELSTFESVGSSYEASQGNHDDLVMNLVLFAWFVATDIFANMSTNFSLKDMLYAERVKAMEDELIPPGFFHKPEDNYPQQMREVDKQGTVWTSQVSAGMY